MSTHPFWCQSQKDKNNCLTSWLIFVDDWIVPTLLCFNLFFNSKQANIIIIIRFQPTQKRNLQKTNGNSTSNGPSDIIQVVILNGENYYDQEDWFWFLHEDGIGISNQNNLCRRWCIEAQERLVMQISLLNLLPKVNQTKSKWFSFTQGLLRFTYV